MWWLFWPPKFAVPIWCYHSLRALSHLEYLGLVWAGHMPNLPSILTHIGRHLSSRLALCCVRQLLLSSCCMIGSFLALRSARAVNADAKFRARQQGIEMYRVGANLAVNALLAARNPVTSSTAKLLHQAHCRQCVRYTSPTRTNIHIYPVADHDWTQL